MQGTKARSVIVAVALLVGLLVIALQPERQSSERGGSGEVISLSVPVGAAEAVSWREAARRVNEDRGEPTGNQARIVVPQQLRHYSDTRRFLAIQVAEHRKHGFETPHDFASLAGMIRRGELTELQSVSQNYILYGLGASASAEPFAHYDRARRRSVPLYNEAGLAQEYARLAESRSKLEQDAAALRRELSGLSRSERSRRAGLQSQLSQKERTLTEERERKELLDHYYGAPARREHLFAEYESISQLAGGFFNRSYDLDDARARQQMKARLLSFLRPEAARVLDEIAASYRERFDRPLPITSLVRPDEYQIHLSRTNPNATLIQTPPHSMGLAFDVYNRHMTAEEQAHVMAHLARLQDAGRIEALRENRDHFHVFAFIDGQRPSEDLIRQSLGQATSARAQSEPRPAQANAARVNVRSPRPEARRSSPPAARRGAQAAARQRQSQARGRRR